MQNNRDIVDEPEDQRFLPHLIGKALLFKDALSVTIQKVVIDPSSRRVVAVVAMGRFTDALRQSLQADGREERSPEHLVVLPVGVILLLSRTSGFLKINSTETTQYEDFVLSRYTSPDKNWLPPYPYLTDEVLFLVG